jgi:hypothetical protein
MLFGPGVEELSILNPVNVPNSKATFHIHHSFHVCMADKLVIALVFFQKDKEHMPLRE